MTYTVDEKLAQILYRYDPDDLVDILNLSSKEIINAFPEKIIQCINLFDLGEDEYDEDENSKTNSEV